MDFFKSARQAAERAAEVAKVASAKGMVRWDTIAGACRAQDAM